MHLNFVQKMSDVRMVKMQAATQKQIFMYYGDGGGHGRIMEE